MVGAPLPKNFPRKAKGNTRGRVNDSRSVWDWKEIPRKGLPSSSHLILIIVTRFHHRLGIIILFPILFKFLP